MGPAPEIRTSHSASELSRGGRGRTPSMSFEASLMITTMFSSFRKSVSLPDFKK